MRYKSCQSKWLCPDKIGHFVGFFWFAWFVIHFLGLQKGIIAIVIALLVEVYEFIATAPDKPDSKNILDWLAWLGNRWIKWFDFADTQKDIVVDFLGVAIAIFIYPFWNFYLWAFTGLVALFFVRFVSWQELKDYWWDVRLWRYF